MLKLKSKKDDVVLEKKIEKCLCREVGKLGGKAYKFKSDNNRGVHDRLCVLPEGITFYVEVKRPGKRPTALQAKTIQDFKDLGHYSTWVSTEFEVYDLISQMQEAISYAKQNRPTV